MTDAQPSRSSRRSSADFARKAGPFPLTMPFTLAGLVVAIVLGALTNNLALAFSGWTLLASCGLVWHRTLPAAFPFCLAYQWLFSVTGPIVYGFTGDYPGGGEMGDIERAVWYSQFSFLALALGLRFGLRSIKPNVTSSDAFHPAVLRRLFVTTVIASALGWLLPAERISEMPGIGQIVLRFVMFLTVPFIMFTMYCLKHRRGLRQFLIAFAIAWVPSFASQMSGFSYLLLVSTVCLLSFWKPWSDLPDERRNSARVLPALAVSGVVLTVAALVWNGSIKPVWRMVQFDEAAPLLDRLADFGRVSEVALDNFTLDQGLDESAKRFSSDVEYFSLVLSRVPEITPHTHGAFTRKAIQHSLLPRLLFPNKDVIGSDSEATMEYTGIYAASDEQETSVGMGYMSYFYIDFAFPAMLLAIFVLGLFWGTSARLLWISGNNQWLSPAAVIIFALNNCTGYGSDVAKSLGGAVMTVIVFAAILFVSRTYIVKFLLNPPSGDPLARRV
jgi:hypothetical protein